MWWGYDGGTSWWIFCASGMAVFWASAIGLAAWGISRQTGRRTDEEPLPSGIAPTRYARGEITREEFQRIKGDLRAL